MGYGILISELEHYVQANLTDKRKRHTYGVRDTACELSERFKGDSEKAIVAALAHDMYRGLKGDELRNTVRKLGLDPRYEDDPNLAHGKIAAIMLHQIYGVGDPDIINAVSYHTTGRKGMSLLEKIIYLADCIEPGRDYPGVDEIRGLAMTSLDEACLKAMQGTVKHVVEHGSYLDRDTLEAANYLKEQLKENK